MRAARRLLTVRACDCPIVLRERPCILVVCLIRRSRAVVAQDPNAQLEQSGESAPESLPLGDASTSETPSREVRPRLLFGIGLHLGINDVKNPLPPPADNPLRASDDIVGFGQGGYLRLGLQLTDRLGFDAEASGGYGLFAYYARVAVDLRVTPVDWLILGSGPVGGVAIDPGFALGWPLGSGGPAPTAVGSYIGQTARIEFHPAGSRGPTFRDVRLCVRRRVELHLQRRLGSLIWPRRPRVGCLLRNGLRVQLRRHGGR